MYRLAMLGTLAALLSAAEFPVPGRVVDENGTPVAGVRVGLTGAQGSGEAVTDATGAFSVNAAPGAHLLSARKDGFFALKDRRVEIEPEAASLHVVLNRIRATSESVDVSASVASLDIEQTASERRITDRQILDVPYPATRSLRNALRIMPGVTADRAGNMHFDGGLENQVFYTLNGFNIGDPITGRFSTKLSVEAVRSVEYSSGRYSPEFGKGSAGALAVETPNGDDRLRYSATNFVPGVEHNGGWYIGTWSPRLNFSGPLRKGRAWFSDSVDAECSQAVIPDLPAEHNRTTRVRGSNLLHGQVNLTPANLLFGDFLAGYETAPKSGMSALDPLSTSIDRSNRQWFYSVKDQVYLGRGSLLEFGFAQNRTRARERPQGESVYLITPEGRSGNYFVDTVQHARRDQLLANYWLPSSGNHRVKVGADLTRLEFRQSARRTGYEHYDTQGNLLSRTTFGGSGELRLANTEGAFYAVDVWRARPNLTVEYGLRLDRDKLVRQAQLSPRAAVSYAPLGWKRTKFSAGYAIIYDAASLEMFARPLDQYSITWVYSPSGELLAGPATIRYIKGSELRGGRSRNLTFGWEQEIRSRLRFGVNLLRRRGTGGPMYLRSGEGAFELRSERRDSYDAAALTLQHSFGREYGWLLNYTRSRALSNAVIDLSVDQPLYVLENYGRVSWDAPDRLLSWGYLPGWSRNWALSYLLDVRSGYPFSVVRQDGVLAGPPNSRRFPANFALNLHLERKLRLGPYRFAIRAGMNNITNSLNATGVNNVADSPKFLTWYGHEGRHGVFRLRWLRKE